MSGTETTSPSVFDDQVLMCIHLLYAWPLHVLGHRITWPASRSPRCVRPLCSEEPNFATLTLCRTDVPSLLHLPSHAKAACSERCSATFLFSWDVLSETRPWHVLLWQWARGAGPPLFPGVDFTVAAPRRAFHSTRTINGGVWRKRVVRWGEVEKFAAFVYFRWGGLSDRLSRSLFSII